MRGQQLVDDLIAEFGLETKEGIKHAAQHHDAPSRSGQRSGYPLGLEGPEIPIEARIIAVRMCSMLSPGMRGQTKGICHAPRDGGTKLEPECIDALERHRDQIAEIQKKYAEDRIG